ncbi:MAG: hypothetical protein R3C68_18740, partial [Myxococcota bacterium]
MSAPLQQLLLFLGLVSMGCGCTLVKAYSTKTKSSDEAAAVSHGDRGAETGTLADPDDLGEDIGDEEGVEAIVRLIRKFGDALKAKDFDRARKLYARAARSVSHANEVTRGHPDFEDTQALVVRARKRLDVAIEQHRIAMRNKAIDELIDQGRKLMTRAQGIYAEMARRNPTGEDVKSMDQVLADFDRLRVSGREYTDTPRYVSHSDDRDARAAELRELRQRSEWFVKAQGAVTDPADTAFGATVKARNATAVQEQIKYYGEAAASFSACVKVVDDLQKDTFFDKKRVFPTKLGTQTFLELQTACRGLALQAENKVAFLRWREGVEETVKLLQPTITALTAATEADKLALSRRANDVLAVCSKKLGEAIGAPGYAKQEMFKTPYGEMTAAAFLETCNKQQEKLVNALPRLTWKESTQELVQRLALLHQALQVADKQTELDKKLSSLNEIQQGFEICVVQAQNLAKKPGADAQLKLDTAFGRLNLGGIVKICEKHQEKTKETVKETQEQRQAQIFANKTQGDEKAVVLREGVPTRIIDYEVGRVFLYEEGKGKKTITRRFGFDQSGKAVDFWAQWRKGVVEVAAELSAASAQLRDTPRAEDKLQVMDKMLGQFDHCQARLGQLAKSPGADAKAVFTTTFGKLNVGGLIEACGAQRSKLRGQVPQMKWQQLFEALADRVNDAKAQLAASSSTDPDKQLAMVSRAKGGFLECKERGAELMKQS